jgi:hypothetical protein
VVLEFICMCFYFVCCFCSVFTMADITDASNVVDPWVESDTEPDYNPWEPRFSFSQYCLGEVE